MEKVACATHVSPHPTVLGKHCRTFFRASKLNSIDTHCHIIPFSWELGPFCRSFSARLYPRSFKRFPTLLSFPFFSHSPLLFLLSILLFPFCSSERHPTRKIITNADSISQSTGSQSYSWNVSIPVAFVYIRPPHRLKINCFGARGNILWNKNGGASWCSWLDSWHRRPDRTPQTMDAVSQGAIAEV